MKILVGYSGGIDSTRVILDFLEKGHDVTAIYLILYENSAKNKDIIESSAEKLKIPVLIKDERKYFKNTIIDYFLKSYKNGITPNPCFMCNRIIKFPLFDKYRQENSCNYFSTGHYVDIQNSRIRMAEDNLKDQSYFVAGVKKENLIHFINSCNSKNKKNENREYLDKMNVSYNSKESQEICFIENDYIDFLHKNGVKSVKGSLIDNNGNTVGIHDGYYKFTIGKRKGLKKGFNERMYVKKIDACKNNVYIAPINYMKFKGMKIQLLEKYDNIEKKHLFVKIRYKSSLIAIKNIIEIEKNIYDVFFHDIQNAVSPGQIAVFYDNKEVLMSGVILNYIEEE